jgi:hypothetical protein
MLKHDKFFIDGRWIAPHGHGEIDVNRAVQAARQNTALRKHPWTRHAATT